MRNRLTIYALIFLMPLSACKFEIPILTTKYVGGILKQGFQSKEQCLRFNEKVDGQTELVERACEIIFSEKATEIATKRLLCMRRGIEDATTNSQSRSVIFSCYEQFPSNKSNALDRAKYYFPTQEEIINNQIRLNNLRPKRPFSFECFGFDGYMFCDEFR